MIYLVEFQILIALSVITIHSWCFNAKILYIPDGNFSGNLSPNLYTAGC